MKGNIKPTTDNQQRTSETILKVENLSKQYRLGLVGTGTISHDFNRFIAKIRGKEDPYLKIGDSNDRASKGESDYVWALKDINFDVKKGDVLGIIGKNGAGKSTLLKILSKVTGPTTGSIKSKGRIASLLEVGTGFHPEMTGKENIFLNGAILGMTKKEIADKLDEIVEFSGCERYIDTPVKRYSSGMKVRLAFAVAAHLEPDILIVDEVLAVGDAEFQKKAIGKMQDISGTDGRTVLFVSHNMAAVKNLCRTGVVLKDGTTVFEGTSDEAVDFYLQNNITSNHISLEERTDRKGNGEVYFTKAHFINEKNKITSEIISGEKLSLVISYKNKTPVLSDQFFLGVTIYDNNEIPLSVIATDEMGFDLNIKERKGKIVIEFPNFIFRAGQFSFRFFLSKKKHKASENIILDLLEDAIKIDVLPGDYWNTGVTNRPNGFILNANFIHED